jgi:hypothetical protein
MQPVIYNWIAATPTAIFNSNNIPPVPGQRSFVLNGDLFNPLSVPGLPISLGRIARVISITSTGNVSAVNFTITGTYNGLPVSQTIAGPNATTVYTTQFFNTVDSVTFNTNVTSATNVGTGNAGVAPAGAWGVTNWFVYDFFTPFSMLTAQAKVNAVTVNYSLEVTLDDVVSVPEASLTLFNPIAGMTNATTNQIGNINFPIRYARLKFNNATNSAGSLTATFLQQGLQ